MAGTLDFTQPKHAAFSAAVQLVVDDAMRARQAADDARVAADPLYQRPAIGVGGLGKDCLRALGYEYHRVPKDPARAVKPGSLLRIFKRGHNGEADMAEYMRLAGFELLTEDPKTGRQYRFDDAPYEDGKGRIKGMVDGLIVAGPAELATSHQESPEHPAQRFRMAYPMLWENKELKNKKWNAMMKKGVRDTEADYFTQAQMLMAHFSLAVCLFTAKNADTQEIFAELIPFDARFAQAASDKAVRIISSSSPEELLRVAQAADDFRCKFCDWQERCWQRPVEPAPVTPAHVPNALPAPVPNAAPARPSWLAPPAGSGTPASSAGLRTLAFTGDRGRQKP